jgi:hypothetical protein
MEPAVITFRPDNFLTIGLIGLIVYVAAVLAAQGLMRAGVIPSSSSSMSDPTGAAAPDRVIV